MDIAPNSPEYFNALGRDHLPGFLGITTLRLAPGERDAELTIAPRHMAPNGYLHAGTVVTLADTAAGYGCLANLPPGATSFTTIELKSNFTGTARAGTIAGFARMVHGGRSTQVWDVTVRARETGAGIAYFRCTQMIIYPR